MSRNASDAPSGESLFVSNLALIERVIAFICSRHRLSADEADDFGSHVKLKFIEDQYPVFAKFQGRSSLQTYLVTVIQRILLDYRISAWGKWRPSMAAKRAGPVAILLEQLIVRDGVALEVACELMRTNHGVAASRTELERLAGRLPVRPRRRFESDDGLASLPSTERPADEAMADREYEQTAQRLCAVLAEAMEGLDAKDRLILALRFEDGRTVPEIAAMVRVDQKGLYRHVARLLGTLRTALEARGIDSSAVREMLEAPAVSIEWRETSTKSSTSRPSMGKDAPEWR